MQSGINWPGFAGVTGAAGERCPLNKGGVPGFDHGDASDEGGEDTGGGELALIIGQLVLDPCPSRAACRAKAKLVTFLYRSYGCGLSAWLSAWSTCRGRSGRISLTDSGRRDPGAGRSAGDRAPICG